MLSIASTSAGMGATAVRRQWGQLEPLGLRAQPRHRHAATPAGEGGA